MAALLAACWAIFGPNVVPVPDPPLRFGLHDRIAHTPFLLAEASGLLDPTRIRISELASTSALALGLRNGTFDATAMSLEEALAVVDTGADVAVAAVLAELHGADVVVAGAGVDSVASLRGKRVGVELQASSTHVLALVLAKAGLGRDDVVVVELPPDRHEGALEQHEVDAVVTFEPLASTLVSRGAHVLDDGGALGEGRREVLLVRRSVLVSRHDDVERMLASWFRAVHRIADDRSGSLAWLSRSTGRSTADLDHALSTVSFVPFEDQKALVLGPAPGLAQAASREAALLRSEGLVAHDDCALRLLPTPRSGADAQASGDDTGAVR